MLRLEVMPLVPDFGESLSHPLNKINPNTRLKFTRDYRIFGQLSNFPDTPDEQPDHIIQTQPLPDGFTVGSASEEDGVTFGRGHLPKAPTILGVWHSYDACQEFTMLPLEANNILYWPLSQK